jgi:hypothetical protein
MNLAAIALVVGIVIGAGPAVKLTADHYKAKAVAAELAAAEAYQARTVELNQVSADLERAKHEKQVVYRTITKRVQTYIDRPIYLRDAYDDDGVRDVNATFADATDPGQPGARVPGADSTGRKDRRNRPAEND